jgi:membrane AbrB-like protein
MRIGRPRDWLLAVVAIVACGWLLGRVGIPSSYLFAAMLTGLAFALTAPGRITLPTAGFRVGQAITGVAIGTFLRSSVVTGLGSRWIPVILVSLGTLALTVAAGLLLARVARLDRATASLGMIAGGASGIVGMSEELGGDDRLVAFMQYLRVLIITLLTPVLVPLAFGVQAHGGQAGEGPLLGNFAGWVLVIGVGGVGAAIGPRLRLPAPALLGPMILTAVLSVIDVTASAEIPALLREAGFVLIGLRIGLGFERDTLRQMAATFGHVLACIATLLLACFGLGWVLKVTAGVSALDGYLATTPGGLYAVLPIAYGAGANATFVLAVQVLRLFAMMLAAPAIVRMLLRPRSRRRPPPRGSAAEAAPR